MDKLNRWLTLLANIGVLIGLVLVAVQLQQTNDALLRDQRAFEVDNYEIIGEAMQNFLVSVLSDDHLRVVWIKGNRAKELNADELYTYDQLVALYARNHRSMHEVWEKAGEGRGQFAVHDLVAELRRHPGMKSSFNRFISLERSEDDGDIAQFYETVGEGIRQ